MWRSENIRKKCIYLSFIHKRLVYFSLGWLLKGWLVVADWWAEDLSLYTPGPECEAAVSSGKPSKNWNHTFWSPQKYWRIYFLKICFHDFSTFFWIKYWNMTYVGCRVRIPRILENSNILYKIFFEGFPHPHSSWYLLFDVVTPRCASSFGLNM